MDTANIKPFHLIASRIWFREADQERLLVTSYPTADNKVVVHSILTRTRSVIGLDELAECNIDRAATAQDWTMAGVEQVDEEGHYVDGDDLFCDLNDNVADFG